MATKMAQDLIQFYLRGGNDADFEVIPLKNANAVDAAKILDEAFNGKQQQNQRGNQNQQNLAALFGRGGGGGGGGVLPQAPETRTETVRIVADPATNSLLVKAGFHRHAGLKTCWVEQADDNDNDPDITCFKMLNQVRRPAKSLRSSKASTTTKLAPALVLVGRVVCVASRSPALPRRLLMAAWPGRRLSRSASTIAATASC